ncbi:MAG: class I SAM-dependent methyltransferase [Sarcina sp.]
MNFDELAKMWNSKESIDRAALVAGHIENTLNLNKKQRAMEFGCGTGILSFNLKNKFEHIDLIDTSKGMLDVALESIKKDNIKNISIKNVNLSNESIAEKYDVIYSSMALHHVKDVEDMVRKFYNMLVENGQIAIAELNEDNGDFHWGVEDFNGHNGFNQAEFKNMFETIGFRNIKVQEIFKGNKNQKGKEITYSVFIIFASK